MATGQVSFHSQSTVRKIHVPVRQNAIVNRLNKTKVEKKAKEREEKAEREQQKYQKDHAYTDLMREENMISNDDVDPNTWEDDFM